MAMANACSAPNAAPARRSLASSSADICSSSEASVSAISLASAGLVSKAISRRAGANSRSQLPCRHQCSRDQGMRQAQAATYDRFRRIERTSRECSALLDGKGLRERRRESASRARVVPGAAAVAGCRGPARSSGPPGDVGELSQRRSSPLHRRRRDAPAREVAGSRDSGGQKGRPMPTRASGFTS